MTRRNRGFSLAEISMVLLVVGLVAGAVVAGQFLYKRTTLNTVMNEVATIYQAMVSFKNEYGTYPGDVSDTTRFPRSTVVSAGNGDGNPTSEVNGANSNFFTQLYAGGAIDILMRDWNGVTAVLPTGNAAGTLYPSQIADSGYHAVVTDKAIFLVLRNINLSSFAMSAIDLQALDERFDDGLPTSGIIRVFNSGTGSPCLNETTSPISYSSSSSKVCTPMFKLENIQSLVTSSSISGQCSAVNGVGSKFDIGSSRISSTTLCPTGMTGDVFEVCSPTQGWIVAYDTCKPKRCYGGKFAGATQSVTLPSSFVGDMSLTCSDDGAWVPSEFVTNSPMPSYTPDRITTNTVAAFSPLRRVPCPYGYSGAVEQFASAGTWVQSTVGCARDNSFGWGNNIQPSNPLTYCPTGYVLVNQTQGQRVLSDNAISVEDNCVPDNTFPCSPGTNRTLACRPHEQPNGGGLFQECRNGVFQTVRNDCRPITCGGASLGTLRPNTQGLICPATTPSATDTTPANTHIHINMGKVYERCSIRTVTVNSNTFRSPQWVADYRYCRIQ